MSNIKMLRGQVRQIVKELLPEVFKEELTKAIQKEIEERLNRVDSHVKAAVAEMNERSKETQNYVVRNLVLATTQAAAPKPVDSSASSQK